MMKNITLYMLLFVLISSCSSSHNPVDFVSGYLNSEPGGSFLVKDSGIVKIEHQGLSNMDKSTLIGNNTHFRMASVSKQFTAMATWLLIKKGVLKFETPIHTYFPELPITTAPITVGQLLNHSSGIMDYESLIADTQQTQLLDQDILQLVSQQDSVYFTAGSKFRYSNTGYCLLALIVEKVSGLAYADFVKEHIFDVLQLKNALVYSPTSQITDRAFGYHPINGTFKFADQSLTSATKGDGGVYISMEEYNIWLDRSNSLLDSSFFAVLEQHKILVKDEVYYSLGWFLGKNTKGERFMFHSGESTGFHNFVIFNPDANCALAIFNNRDDQKIVTAIEEITTKKQVFQWKQLHLNIFQWLSKVYSNQ